jgi:hypothetical protein
MRREFRDADLCGEFLDDMPDKLFCYSVAPSSASAADTTEEMPRFNASSPCPFGQLSIHPVWNGNGANVTSLSSQIHDCPMPFALLQMVESQISELVTTESTGKQHGEQGTIPFTLQPLTLRGLPKRLPLFSRQPVANPHTQFLDTLDAPYSRRQIRAQQSAIRRLICKTSDCSKAEIDCAWCKVTRLQMHTVANDYRLAER